MRGAGQVALIERAHAGHVRVLSARATPIEQDVAFGVALQLTASHKVATPANWQRGDDVIIAGSVSNDQAVELFGEWESPKPYIRIVPQPVS
jgi:hypothetical protein